MTEPEPPPTDCIRCKEPNCNDWMYKAGLVPAEQAICGKCKIEIGGKMLESMANIMRDEIKNG